MKITIVDKQIIDEVLKEDVRRLREYFKDMKEKEKIEQLINRILWLQLSTILMVVIEDALKIAFEDEEGGKNA